MFLMALMIPVNSLILKQLRKNEDASMELKDSRLKVLSEILNGIKVSGCI